MTYLTDGSMGIEHPARMRTSNFVGKHMQVEAPCLLSSNV